MGRTLGIALAGFVACLLAPQVVVDAQVVDGMGFYVRPSRPVELGTNPPEWLFFPYSVGGQLIGDPPKYPPPAQGDIVLTPQDPLTVLVPLFAHFPASGHFGTSWNRQGDTITINGYFYMGGITGTEYGPHEYICPIGTLPAGVYKVHTNYFLWGDQNWDAALAADFLSNPASFAADHGVPVIDLDTPSEGLVRVDGAIRHESLEFTVVPEPTTLAILFAGMIVASRRRMSI
jgi:hypothetical protein